MMETAHGKGQETHIVFVVPRAQLSKRQALLALPGETQAQERQKK